MKLYRPEEELEALIDKIEELELALERNDYDPGDKFYLEKILLPKLKNQYDDVVKYIGNSRLIY